MFPDLEGAAPSALDRKRIEKILLSRHTGVQNCENHGASANQVMRDQQPAGREAGLQCLIDASRVVFKFPRLSNVSRFASSTEDQS